MTNKSLTIREFKRFDADPTKNLVPSIIYDVVLGDDVIGKLSLRLGDNENIYFGGHLGYTIYEAYRGHGYAYQACELLREVASDEGFSHLIITCNPDNMPSIRTCEKLGAELIEEVDVPEHNDMYHRGEHKKLRFKWTL